jgi:hypothetical protein
MRSRQTHELIALILLMVLVLTGFAVVAHAEEGPLTRAVATVDASTFPQEGLAPITHDRLDVGLGIVSLSAASIATGLTATCLTAGSCREVMPLMKRWTTDSIPKAILLRTAIQGGLHYAVYRFAPKGRPRTWALAALAVVNTADAVHDIRVTSKESR